MHIIVTILSVYYCNIHFFSSRCKTFLREQFYKKKIKKIDKNKKKKVTYPLSIFEFRKLRSIYSLYIFNNYVPNCKCVNTYIYTYIKKKNRRITFIFSSLR